MLLVFSVLVTLLFVLNGAAALVQRNKVRESRRRQARSLSLARAASENYRQYMCQPEAQRQQPGIALMNIGSEV